MPPRRKTHKDKELDPHLDSKLIEEDRMEVRDALVEAVVDHYEGEELPKPDIDAVYLVLPYLEDGENEKFKHCSSKTFNTNKSERDKSIYNCVITAIEKPTRLLN